MRLLVASLATALLLALAGAGGAAAKTVWLCKPGLRDNPCLDSRSATVIGADGSNRTERGRRARRPKIDCFYVYPTVSGQPGALATRAIDPEIRAIASLQASRFAPVCRPFAPVYRQATISGITTEGAITRERAEVAFGDVAAAWREYLRRHNRGRGVVLIGHSQGTYMLRALAARLVDGNRAVRRRLVSALLIGGDVSVRRGRDRGGDFDRIPACRRSGQIGCVVAYSAFYGTPPDDTRFGVPDTRFFGGGSTARLEVLCTDPTRLAGDAGVLRPYFPTERFPGTIGLVQPDPPVGFSTPWVSTPGLYRARCASGNGANYLDVNDVGAPSDQRLRVTESLGPTWGLHLVDMNLAYGNLVSIVERQARAYLRRR